VLLTSDQPATKSSTTYVQIVPSLHYPTAPYSPSTVDVGPYPPLTCSLAASFATKLLSFFTFHSSTLLTSSPFPSMSFATFVALRSRNIASAAKGPKVYDLTRPPAGGLAFRPRSPLGELTFALPNSPQTIVCSNFLPSLHAYTSAPRCVSPRGLAVLPSPPPRVGFSPYFCAKYARSTVSCTSRSLLAILCRRWFHLPAGMSNNSRLVLNVSSLTDPHIYI